MYLASRLGGLVVVRSADSLILDGGGVVIPFRALLIGDASQMNPAQDIGCSASWNLFNKSYVKMKIVML